MLMDLATLKQAEDLIRNGMRARVYNFQNKHIKYLFFFHALEFLNI